MAKRVFELARELNLTTKALLVTLKDMEVTVKSHMSTVDEAMEAHVREHLFGNKSDEAIEETRIRPTVIRRRRKAVPETALSKESQEGSGVAAEVETAENADLAVETPTEKEPDAVSHAIPEETEPAEPESIAPKKPEAAEVSTRVEGEPAAQPETPLEITPEAPEPGIGPADAAHPAEPVTVSEAPAMEEGASEGAAEQPETPETEIAAPVPPAGSPSSALSESAEEKAAAGTEPVEPAPPAGTPQGDAAEPASAPKAVKGKKGKKKHPKDTPAKIIQLPVSPPEPVERPDRKEGAPAEQGRWRQAEETIESTEEDSGASGDKKKGKRGRKVPAEEASAGKDKRFFKKKIAFRRKEVVEGAALYAGENRGRKGRKGAKGGKPAPVQKPQITVAKAIKRRVKVDETIVLSELAKRMGIKAADMIRTLMGMGVMATVNQTIDFDTAVLVAGEFGYEVERAAFEEEAILKTQADDPEKMMARPPVVTIMGHVDHGKTSLLDMIRKTRITATEAGGITQHIGAYNVSTEKGQVVFLDTPGHEAFTAMRARGAKVTDLVVLVVAADDGVMPQTVEAINHSRASEVPIVVAINKIDKANADPDRVVRQLAELGLAPEEWGGDTIFVRVSAKQNQGIDDLLEMILLQAEMMELRGDPHRLATGHVVEAKLDSGRGPVATILVQGGTLHTGDSVVCGVHYGKVRAMLNDVGKQVSSAGPAMPVEIIGLSGVPMAGDEMVALESEKDAKQVSLHRTQKLRSQELAKSSRMSLEGLFEKMKSGEVKDLNLIIKADVDGSIEALRDSLVKLSNEEVKINVVHSATGTITESDVSLAAVSDAIIIGFNVRPNTKVSDMAHEENVDVRLHNIIYDVIQEVKNAIVGMMASTFEERLLGKAEVRQVFHVPKVGAIAGCFVTDGKIERGQQVRLLRDGVIRYEGKVASLRRFKDDMKEVSSGYECGIGISNFNDIKVGDTVECFYMEEIRPEID
jgi:translation initiation factor IF-2